MSARRNVRLPLMVTQGEAEQIDEWRFRHRVGSRAEAIRKLIGKGLDLDQIAPIVNDVRPVRPIKRDGFTILTKSKLPQSVASDLVTIAIEGHPKAVVKGYMPLPPGYREDGLECGFAIVQISVDWTGDAGTITPCPATERTLARIADLTDLAA